MDDLVKRADEALRDVTPGPWVNHDYSGAHEDDPHCTDVRVSCSHPDELSVCNMNVADIGYDPNKQARAYAQAVINARFIAAARELVPAMRDRIEADAKRIAEIARLRSGGDDFDALIADARAEAEKAMRKFPQPNYVISKVAEEAGEVVKAAIHCAEGRETVENLRGEMKQLIAMIYRLWVEGDGVHGLPPARAALTGEKGK